MRRHILIMMMVLVASSVSLSAATERFVPITGNAPGVVFFRTDLRMMNPSTSKEIDVVVKFLPLNTDNSIPASTRTVHLLKREMKSFDNVLDSLFSISGQFGALRFESADDFVVTSKTFADNPCTAAGGTFGQFIPSFDMSDAVTRGTILQLSHTPFEAASPAGYRSNIGFFNPNASATTIALKLYGSNNAVVGNGTLTLPPFGATIGGIPGVFGLASNFTTTNGWVSFVASQKVIGYGSVVDNKSADQIFIAAFPDSGTVPAGQAKTFEITASRFQFVVTPGGAGSIGGVNVGDTVTLRITAADTTHGFSMPGLVEGRSIAQGTTSVATFLVTEVGQFPFFCTVTSCGSGHLSMRGTMVVAEAPDPDPGY